MSVQSFKNVNAAVNNLDVFNSSSDPTNSVINVTDNSDQYLETNYIETVDVGVEESCLDAYSSTGYSSYSNIFINQYASNINNSVKNKFGDNTLEYYLYVRYIEGLTLRDLTDEEGYLNLIDTDEEIERFKDIINSSERNLSDEEVQAYLDVINGVLSDKSICFSGYASEIGIDDRILDSKILEVVNEINGYDAMVLENDSEIWIVNSCTNEQSSEDISAIGYTILRQLAGSDDLYDYLSPLIQASDFGDESQGSNNTEGIDFDACIRDLASGEAYFNNQVEANMKLIEKYANGDKTLRLSGYSLGGGMMLDAYARLNLDTLGEYDDVTVSVFNPFISYCEKDDANVLGILSDILVNSDNVVIYSTEGDAVTQFCGLTTVLSDQIVYVPGDSSSPATLSDISELLGLITDPNSRHSFLSIDSTAFDENGSLIEVGDQFTTNEIAGGDVATNSYSALVKTLLDNYFDIDAIISEIEADPENAWMAEPIREICEGLKEYAIENAGQYGSTYDEFIDAITPGLTALAEEGGRINTVADKGSLPDIIMGIFSSLISPAFMQIAINTGNAPSVGDVLAFLNNDDAFRDSLYDYFQSDEGKMNLIYLLNCLKVSDNRVGVDAEEVMSISTDMITDVYINSIVDSVVKNSSDYRVPNAFD